MKNSQRNYWDEISSLGVCIDWFGPYDCHKSFIEHVTEEPKNTRLIYFAEDSDGHAQYVGITESPNTRFASHHKIAPERGETLWYGIINSQGKSGRRTKAGNIQKSSAPDLDQAETALINWLWPENNEVKVNRRPSQTISIANRFFSSDDAPTLTQGPEALPRILFYDWISNRYTVLHD